ncbi:uncharacterized protein LOC142748001 isoform X2 [Rhinoderma darwinii]|uniref:uncharacterized protein LOC142748001 isoform X2 n=1 Tax=Rhinoderma darwinii TaxID=43563 RepID=UPI003F673645
MDCTSTEPADQYGNTRLHYEAHAGNLDMVRRLMQDGYSVLSQNASGLTPLHMAAFGGNAQVLEMLLSSQPINAINIRSIKDSTLLHEAVCGRSLETVQLLIEKGADTNLQDQAGNTPLHLAAFLRPASLSIAICQALLKGGSNPSILNLVEENFIIAVLRGAAMEGCRSSELLVTLALKHHPDLLSRNSVGLTVLDEARKITAPINIIRLIKEKTQEQQNQTLSKNVTLQYNHRPVESVSSDKIPIMEVGSWKPGKKVRLFICGQTGVGKTTFANALKETGPLAILQHYLTGPKIPPSTKGVVCSQTGLEGTSLAIWDFAGQMEYCFSHSLLLRTSGPNTLYCVMFSLEGIESDIYGGQRRALEQLMFWLRFLSMTHSSQSKPHVFLIGSHLDTLPHENNTSIAKHFYENVMKTEFDLFSCFQMQFFALNCRNMSHVNAIREPLSKTVSQAFQNSTEDYVPEICQLIMEQVSHLRSQKLLYLPQYFLQRKHSATKPCQNITTERSPKNVLPSGLIILDLNWLLQDVFGGIGHYALSPASGTNKQRWSSKEIAAALNMTNGEVDSECVLELLEAFQLVFKTQEGEFVVPGWLKKGGPERHGGWENMRGVGYRWNYGSRGLFSHFLVGRLQIQLMCMFGTDRCQLWKEGALLVTNAQLRVEVSEDKRSLYLIGGWRIKAAEGDCYQLLETVGNEVEILLRNEHEHHYEKLHLCPTELRNVTVSSEVAMLVGFVRSAGIVEEFSGFSFTQIMEAEKKKAPLCGKWNMQPWEVLFPQHDTRMLSSLGMNCSSRWLEGATLLTLCSLLDTKSPVELNWKRLGELLGEASNSTVTEIEEEARNRGLSATNLILNKYPVSLHRLKECLNQMGREDCIKAIDNMMIQLKHKVDHQ